MQCPVCRTGKLVWAWTLDDPGFSVGVLRCQAPACGAALDVRPRIEDFPGDDTFTDAVAAQYAHTGEEVRI